MLTGKNNVAIGIGAAADATTQCDTCTVGPHVPAPVNDGDVRIGSGGVYLELSKGKARIVGARTDRSTEAVLAGLGHAAQMIGATIAAQSHATAKELREQDAAQLMSDNAAGQPAAVDRWEATRFLREAALCIITAAVLVALGFAVWGFVAW